MNDDFNMGATMRRLFQQFFRIPSFAFALDLETKVVSTVPTTVDTECEYYVFFHTFLNTVTVLS